MQSYDHTLQGSGATEKNALDHALGFDFSTCEKSEQPSRNYNYIDTVNGIDVYYEFVADYYFFTDEN